MKKSSLSVVVLCLGVALTCASLVAAGTYALFSDTVTVNNHLQAGTLKATLIRTAHSYSILDEEGMLKETKVESENVKSEDMSNAFDLPSDALIVPTSKLSASFKIQNNDSVAFNYSVSLILTDNSGDPITSFAEDENYLSD